MCPTTALLRPTTTPTHFRHCQPSWLATDCFLETVHAAPACSSIGLLACEHRTEPNEADSGDVAASGVRQSGSGVLILCGGRPLVVHLPVLVGVEGEGGAAGASLSKPLYWQTPSGRCCCGTGEATVPLPAL